MNPQPVYQADSDSVPIPLNDQLAQDLLEAISIVENSWWSHRHQLAARLRTAFGLDDS